MKILDKLFGIIKKSELKSALNDDAQKKLNAEQNKKFDQAKTILIDSLEIYNRMYCQCAYPRYHQIINLVLDGTGKSFKCYDTDLLIDLSKKYFDIENSELNDENKNQKWVCKKCSSTYEYGWSDFSIYVERQKLKLTNLNTQLIGKQAKKPIPIFLGLMGHSYPAKNEVINVNFEEFEKYMTEK